MINRRKLMTEHYLIVDHITFASDEVGDTTNGRAATGVAWAVDDNVVFKGQLQHILLFALLGFSVQAVAVLEKFQVVGERDMWNLKPPQDATIIDLDPDQAVGLVTAEDVAFLENITNHFRRSWESVYSIVAELEADSTKEYYYGSLLAALAHGMQIKEGNADVNYTLYNYAVYERKGLNMGVEHTDILGHLGPVEVEKAHITLANHILTA